eukprot:COSAG01_NODE_1924_length_8886_cov_6.780699_2_plen_338_part_00
MLVLVHVVALSSLLLRGPSAAEATTIEPIEPRRVAEVPAAMSSHIGLLISRNEPAVVRGALKETEMAPWQDDNILLGLAGTTAHCGSGGSSHGSSSSGAAGSCEQQQQPHLTVRALPRAGAHKGGTPARFVRRGSTPAYAEKNLSLAAFVRSYQDPSHPDILYLARRDLSIELAGLLPILPDFPFPADTMGAAAPRGAHTVYWGSHAPITQLHYDSFDGVVCVVAGGWKKFLLVDPLHASALLYSHEERDGNTSPVSLDQPEETAKRFPLARFVSPFEVVLHPGDCLVIPVYWYHQVESAPERTISVNYWRVVDKARKDIMGKMLCGHTHNKAAKRC